MTWERLIKFEDASGHVRFGDAIVDNEQVASIDDIASRGALKARTYTGDSFLSLEPSDEVVSVKTLLSPVSPKDVPIVKCVGLNYMKHIQEGGRKPPPYPSIFIKPSASVASYNEDIPIPKICQENQLDYEGELVIVIGKTGKDIAESDALNHVAGYVASNDVSARTWQRDPAFAGVVPQWCFSKGFDKFAPLGPVIVSPKVVGNAGQLRLQTFVNGEPRQDSNTNDLLFGVEKIVSFISQGTTLEAGTVIMTGTPAGVAMGMKTPLYLKDGDVVEVRLEGLGSVKNKMVFE